jgi:hypothetical protein
MSLMYVRETETCDLTDLHCEIWDTLTAWAFAHPIYARGILSIIVQRDEITTTLKITYWRE